MKILLTGANGYIGLRLLPELLTAGHIVHAFVRSRERLPLREFASFGDQLRIVEGDLTEESPQFPEDIDVAYFLVHAMGGGGHFAEREKVTALNFRKAVEKTSCRQIVYLGGLFPEDRPLSPHLASRKAVQEILGDGPIPLTALRASIIVGSGSASFEIIRDLVEKLPVLITPLWTRNLCQPIAIRNVVGYLVGVALREETFGHTYDIGGPERLCYQELLRQYAIVRGLVRYFVTVPVLTPRLSSLWLYFMTSTSFPLARSLVESLVYDTVCKDDSIRKIVPQKLLTYHESIEKAFARIAQNRVPSSWFDALASGRLPYSRLRSIHVPEHGILRNQQTVPLHAEQEVVLNRIWSLGGRNGWPSMNWAWKVRGALDRLVGGIGVRRGRRHPSELRPGDAVDFWRVLLADRGEGRLILYAEMKIPGEAWLEFRMTGTELSQTATFRPLGLWGRLYWALCLPFHILLFPRMALRLAGPSQA